MELLSLGPKTLQYAPTVASLTYTLRNLLCALPQQKMHQFQLNVLHRTNIESCGGKGFLTSTFLGYVFHLKLPYSVRPNQHLPFCTGGGIFFPPIQIHFFLHGSFKQFAHTGIVENICFGVHRYCLCVHRLNSGSCTSQYQQLLLNGSTAMLGASCVECQRPCLPGDSRLSPPLV